ncbi:hypothetical protein ABKV19_021571 [Rosa sericea]
MLPSLALASLMSSPDSDFASDSKSLFIIEISITTKFYRRFSLLDTVSQIILTLLSNTQFRRVADFGVAKVVDATGKGAKSMSVIAGSCGYIAPDGLQ